MESFPLNTGGGLHNIGQASSPNRDRNPEPPWNLYKFYSQSDGPWFHRDIIRPVPSSEPSGNLVSSQLGYQQPVYDFPDFRNGEAPSECATIPGDSGYGGSGPTCSVESSSVHEDDRVMDNQLADRMMGSCSMGVDAVNHAISPSAHYCNSCHIWLKTKSELQKHRQRHLKPHMCNYPECPKSVKGFGTLNDLIRHKRTVHNEHQTHGKSYFCRHCTGPSKTQKPWPRADNFRSHLERVHQIRLTADDNMEEYIHRAPAYQEDLNGVGTQVSHLDSQPVAVAVDLQESTELQEDETNLDGSISSNEGRFVGSRLLNQINLAQHLLQEGCDKPPAGRARPDKSQYAQPNFLPGSNEYASNNHQIPGRNSVFLDSLDRSADSPANSLYLNTTSRGRQGEILNKVQLHGMQGHQQAGTSWCTSESISGESTKTVNGYTKSDVPASQESSYGLLDQVDSGTLEFYPPDMSSDPSKMLELLKKIPRELLETALNNGLVTGGESASLASGEPLAKHHHLCAKCPKTFNRLCELKKHAKRHEKPYGCTFKQCNKFFGSKNDWKRHESSQHYLLESWNCEEPDCGKVCHRRESFKNHLYKDHKMECQREVENKLERCRMGRHCDPRFWCGFCVKIIEVKESGVNSWMRRCDHIDYHLFGKEGLEKKDMGEWKYLEDHDTQLGLQDTKLVLSNPGVLPCQAQKPPSGGKTNSTKKRKGNGEPNPRPRKKPETTPEYMWICCNCSTPINLKTSSSCFECYHARCGANCGIEELVVDEE